MHATRNPKKIDPIEVVALALQRLSDQKYLIARRGPGQSGAGEWEFPGGKVESGESQKAALVREIDEELGLKLDESKLYFITDHIEHYPQKSVHLFLWKQIIDQTPAIHLTEHDQYLWLDRIELSHFQLSLGDRPFLPFL